jgi:hypothetical protein
MQQFRFIEKKVKHGLSIRILRFIIMKFKDSVFYQLVYRYPKIAMAVIIMTGVIIIYTYVDFLLTYIII